MTSRPARRVPMLTYHAVTETEKPTPLATSPARFAAQMAALAEGGFQALLLSALLDTLQANEPLPERAVVITFDDGYRSVLDAAAPIMREHGFTATVFLVAGYCEQEPALPVPGWRPHWPVLDWADVEALGAAGFEFGSHTLTHPVLPLLASAEAEREMVGSQDLIALRSGQAARVRAMAYPFGARSAVVEALARRHFDGACGARLGLVGPGCNRFDLERVDAYYLNPPALAARLDAVPLRAYLSIRRALRGARRRFRPDWVIP